jgi:hypothetical protein
MQEVRHADRLIVNDREAGIFREHRNGFQSDATDRSDKSR